MAALKGEDDMAVGNVAGSNIFNILFILGISAVICPLQVSPFIFYRDIPVMIFLSLILIPVLRTGFVITRFEGVLLTTGFIGYTGFLICSK